VFNTLFVTKAPGFVVAGRRIVIAGRTKPAARRVFIRLQKFRAKGGGWTTIRTTRSTSAGRFLIAFVPKGTGAQRFRLLIKPDNRRVQSISRIFTVHVVAPLQHHRHR
jgi:hypothetical protein